VRGGRNWEGFSNDRKSFHLIMRPIVHQGTAYLSGKIVGETILGLQKSVIASVKHFIGNEQETYRNPEVSITGNGAQSVSANIDDRTMHELYLWPFQDAIKAGAGSVMCSYNRASPDLVPRSRTD
jgi:beta-glucosidase